MSDPRPIGVFDSGVGGLTVLREIVRRMPGRIDDLPRRQRAGPVRRPPRRRGAGLLDAVARRARRARRQGDRRRLQHLDRGRRSARSGGATTCRSSASSGPGASAAALATRNRRVGVIATPATIRSHAYFSAIKDENPAVEVYEHATPTLVPLVEAGELSGPTAEAAVAEALAPLLGERDAAGESIFPLPPGATIDTLLLGCTHYPLLRADHRGAGRRGRGDRRFGDRDRVGPGRAARASTASRRPAGRRRRDPPAS